MQGEHEKLIESVNRMSEMNSNHLAKFIDNQSKKHDTRKPTSELQFHSSLQARMNQAISSMRNLPLCGL